MIVTASRCRLSVANLLEASIVVGSRGNATDVDLDLFIQESGIELASVTIEQVAVARQAWRRFGKGHHPAALNFGDCFAYALATSTDEPLLFKGEDFARTDVTRA